MVFRSHLVAMAPVHLVAPKNTKKSIRSASERPRASSLHITPHTEAFLLLNGFGYHLASLLLRVAMRTVPCLS